MKYGKINTELLTGIIIVVLSSLTLFIKGIPIIWIGGFLWGGSLIANSLSNYKTVSNYGGVTEKEIVACKHCGQKVRVPKDRKKYNKINCPNCHKSLFWFWPTINRVRNILGKNLAVCIGILIIVVAFSYSISLRTKPERSFVQNSNSVTESLPDLPPQIAHIDNGYIFSNNKSYLNGLGNLLIKNGLNKDAVIKLVNKLTNKSILTAYVKSKSNYKISNISDGDYNLIFSLGNNWDNANKKFISGNEYEIFEESFDFITTSYIEGDYKKTRYSNYEITLNPVLGGQAKTRDIDKTVFDNI